jgi:hypothetical protein
MKSGIIILLDYLSKNTEFNPRLQNVGFWFESLFSDVDLISDMI